MDKQESAGGVGLLGLLFLVFLVMKLLGAGVVATWSWWWVFSPLWIPAMFGVLIFVFGMILDIVRLLKK